MDFKLDEATESTFSVTSIASLELRLSTSIIQSKFHPRSRKRPCHMLVWPRTAPNWITAFPFGNLARWTSQSVRHARCASLTPSSWLPLEKIFIAPEVAIAKLSLQDGAQNQKAHSTIGASKCKHENYTHRNQLGARFRPFSGLAKPETCPRKRRTSKFQGAPCWAWGLLRYFSRYYPTQWARMIIIWHF